MTSILCVCMGNICRSPAAEAVLKHLAQQQNLNVTIDSAGTTAYHVGNPADTRMQQHAQRRGYTLTSIARQFNSQTDFDNVDIIIAMDNDNFDYLVAQAKTPEDAKKIVKMTQFLQTQKATHIPDPYYGGDAGFEKVLDLLEDACQGLLVSRVL